MPKRKKQFKLGPLQKRWIAYLKRHPERQTQGVLGRIVGREKRMCCLGAAGVLMGTCEWMGDNLIEKKSYKRGTLYSSYKKIGLASGNGNASDGADDDYTPALTSLNDSMQHTWVDIANILEAVPELYFTKSV